MKTTKKIYAALLCLAALTLSFTACEKEKATIEENQVETPETGEVEIGNLTLTVGMEAVAKSTLDGLSPEWVAGDALSAINANGNFKLTLTDAATGTFSGNVEGSYPFLITYPYDASYTASSYSSGAGTLTVPSSQRLAKGQNVAPGALVAAGILSSGTSVTLSNLVSLVKITISRDDIASITFESTTSGQPLAGTVGFTGNDPTTVAVSSGSDAVTLYPEGSCFDAGTYYIAVAPRTIDGVKFTFTNSSAVEKTKQKVVSTTFPRNGGFNFGNLFLTTITTKQELLNWNDDYANHSSWDTAQLGNDIDLEGASWTPHPLPGIFDGDGHAITNIRITSAVDTLCCFFTSVAGTGIVQDLTFGSSEDNSYFRQSNTESNNAFAAPIRIVNDGGKLLNITNYASVDGQGAGSRHVAGICAFYRSSVTASGLVNRGNVTVSASTLASVVNLGGVFATIATKSPTVTGCYNYGSVELSGEAANGGGTSTDDSRVGGIAAFVSSAPTLNQCYNYGTIAVGADCERVKNYLGGISGYASGGASFELCENHEKISDAGCPDAAAVYALGGILGFAETSAVTFVSCSNSGAVEKSGDNGSYANNFYLGGILGCNNIATTSLTGCTNLSGGAVSLKAPASNTGIGNVGGVIGRASAALTVSSCSNYGAVSSSVSLGSLHAGGLMGFASATTWTTGHNYGTVRNTGSATAQLNLGGCVGYATGPTIFSEVVNHSSARVSNYSASTGSGKNGGINIGGIAGHLRTGSPTVTNCDNEAEVSDSTTTDVTDIRLAGIVAMSAVQTEIGRCDNTGNLSVDVSGTTKNLDIGGILGYGNCSINVGTSNCAISNGGTGTVTTASRGMAFGRTANTNGVFKLVGIGGSINSVTIDSTNWSDVGVLYGAKASNTKVYTEGDDACYLL